MKFLYLLKKEDSLTGALKDIMDAQVSSGNDVLDIRLYAGDIDYDELISTIFKYDKVMCF